MGICNSIDNRKINNCNNKEISKILFSKINLIGKGGYGKVRIKNIIFNLNLKIKNRYGKLKIKKLKKFLQ
jgi:hypothetical protein